MHVPILRKLLIVPQALTFLSTAASRGLRIIQKISNNIAMRICTHCEMSIHIHTDISKCCLMQDQKIRCTESIVFSEIKKGKYHPSLQI